ncbi:MAG: CocE/NonD family hydrolase [Myxococcales bacterium]|nr:CocE/NonD family hydrolase [Myxococcales bacterium]
MRRHLVSLAVLVAPLALAACGGDGATGGLADVLPDSVAPADTDTDTATAEDDVADATPDATDDDTAPGDVTDADDTLDTADDTAVAADTAAPPPCGTARVREDLAIPTLDGQALHGWLDRPATADCPLPTILIQTPYSADAAYDTFIGDRESRPLVSSPFYNVVAVDWRGRFGSAGLPESSDPARLRQDTYDIVEWVAAQPWSDGKVGTWGVSALCGVQYKTAVGPEPTAAHPDFATGPPPHLAAMVPIMCAARTEYAHVYTGGVARLESTLALDVLGFGVGGLYLSHPRRDLVWTLAEGGVDLAHVAVPALVVSGWWDLNPRTTLAAFEELVAESDPAVRGAHRLLIGPWIHFATGGEVQSGSGRPLEPEERVYVDTERVIDQDTLAFFDLHLRGVTSSPAATWPQVRYHQENEGWASAATWPPPEAAPARFFMTSDLALTEAAPGSAAAALPLPYDPADPSPTVGGGTLAPYNCVLAASPLVCTLTPDPEKLLLHGPQRQDALLARGDQLTFVTPARATPLRLLGAAKVVVAVATTGADADIAARVLDVDADGHARLIGDGIARVSARGSDNRFDFVAPGTRATLEVPLTKDFAYTIPAGHRLGVMLTGSNWPLYARNPGDGAIYVEDDVPASLPAEYKVGVPQQTVPMRGAGQAVTHTIFVADGASYLEIGVAP